MSLPSHLAAAAAGAILVAATVGDAAPTRQARRYAALDAFAQALTLVAEQHVTPVDDVRLLRDAMRGMLGGLDAYSTYFDPAAYRRLREDTDGEFGGVGLAFAIGDVFPDEIPAAGDEASGEPVITEVYPGGPGAQAGLRPGDRLVAVDDEPTVRPGAPVPPLSRWEARLRGAPGSVVRVRYRRGPATLDATLSRALVKVPSVTHAALPDHVGYAAIRRFAEATAADLAEALTALRASGELRGLVLDLRGNPGGLIDAGVAVADLFLAEGLIVTIAGRGGVLEQHRAQAAGTWPRFPIACLVDQDTASAAEILVGALADHDRCVVVGTRTYGKGSVQTYLDLVDGGGLKLTTAHYLTPAGTALDGRGIAPDRPVEPLGELIVAGPTPADLGAPGEPPTAGVTMTPDLGSDAPLAAAHAAVREALRP